MSKGLLEQVIHEIDSTFGIEGYAKKNPRLVCLMLEQRRADAVAEQERKREVDHG